jgi:hypothetical protein
MAYSRWSDASGFNCFWYTSPETGGTDHIDRAHLTINPKVGDRQIFTYEELKRADQDQLLDECWIADRFPDAPMRSHSDLLRFIHIFFEDMEHNVFRYRGHKQPIAGVIYDEHRPYDNIKVIIARRQQGRR